MCDFGLSKKVHNVQDMNETFCGSPDYLSPEVVRKEGYNYLRDIFSMGVLAYELLHGTTPFFSDDLKEIYRKIKHEQPVIRKPVSADCKRFILACLEKNQDQRLGAVNGMVEVLCHPWLRTIVYSINKENNKLSPFQPYIPKKPVLTSSSPSLNFLNEFYQNGDSPTRQAILPTRYFDFSFRLSQDNPQEFPDVEDAHFQPHDSDMYKMNDTSTISTKAKIKMASNINILS
jgi:serine/threonine protein kinase